MATTIQDFLLRFKTEGQSKIREASDGIKDLSDQVATLGANTGPVGGIIGNLIGKLGPLGLAAGAVGGAFAALGLKAVEIAGQLEDISGATGIASGTLLNFKQSVIDAGGSADDFATLATKLNQSIQEAASGGDAAVKAFRNFGINLLDTNGRIRNTEDVLREIAARFQQGQVTAAQYSAAIDILGRTITRLDPSKLQAIADPIKTEEIKKLDEYGEAIDRVKAKLEAQLITFFGQAAQQAESFFQRIDEVRKQADQAAASRGMVRENTYTQFGPMITERPMTKQERLDFAEREMNKAAEEIRRRNPETPAPAAISGITSVNTGKGGLISESERRAQEASLAKYRDSLDSAALSKRLMNIEREYSQRRQSASEFAKMELRADEQIALIRARTETEISKATAAIKANENIRDETIRTREIESKKAEIRAGAEREISNIRLRLSEEVAKKELDIFIKSYQEQEQELEKINQEFSAYLEKVDKANLQGYEISKRYQEINNELREQIDLEKNTIDLNDRERKLINDIAIELKRRANALKELDKIEYLTHEQRKLRAAEIQQQSEKAIEMIQEQAIIEQQRRENFLYGWQEAYKKFVESANNASQQAETYFNTFINGFEDAIVRFVQTGKLSFKDLVGSIIADFARIQARRMLFNFLGASGLGSFFGGPTMTLGGGMSNGGSTMANTAYMVGERGPEMFIPNMAGRIIPNNQLGNTGNTVNTAVTYNINAVDAASFRQLVARDPQFIYNITEQGRRSQPTRRLS